MYAFQSISVSEMTQKQLHVTRDSINNQNTEMIKSLHDMDLTKVIEMSDETDLAGELACAGGQCEVK